MKASSGSKKPLKKSATKLPSKPSTGKAKAPALKKVRKVAPAKPVLSSGGRLPRRAIFIDVENTSSEESLAAVLARLAIDRASHNVQLVAVGNWRTVGQQLGRRLGTLGAQLVHSAPARGVRDWSDLWIAVAAGCWLGESSAGDRLEIISNDRAFDAVGDAAAARGVDYQRIPHRIDAAQKALADEALAPTPRTGRRRRRSSVRPVGATSGRSVEAPERSPLRVQQPMEEPHGASREQMIAVIERLTGGIPGRWVNIDVLENALKADGYTRRTGSPRLVTRLRTIKEVEVDSHGRVRLVSGTAEPA